MHTQFIAPTTSSQFLPADFSPIYGEATKPDKVGWYCSPWGRLKDIHAGRRLPTTEWEFWWWDGVEWLTYPTSAPAVHQDREWFGLNYDVSSPRTE